MESVTKIFIEVEDLRRKETSRTQRRTLPDEYPGIKISDLTRLISNVCTHETTFVFSRAEKKAKAGKVRPAHDIILEAGVQSPLIFSP